MSWKPMRLLPPTMACQREPASRVRAATPVMRNCRRSNRVAAVPGMSAALCHRANAFIPYTRQRRICSEASPLMPQNAKWHAYHAPCHAPALLISSNYHYHYCTYPGSAWSQRRPELSSRPARI